MKERDDIENLFNDAFSGWEPDVPPDVKALIDQQLFEQNKRGFFFRFRWVLLLFILAATAVSTLLITRNTENSIQTKDTNETAHNIKEISPQSETSKAVNENKQIDYHDEYSQNESSPTSTEIDSEVKLASKEPSSTSTKSTKTNMNNSTFGIAQKTENTFQKSNETNIFQTTSRTSNQTLTQKSENQSEPKQFDSVNSGSKADNLSTTKETNDYEDNSSSIEKPNVEETNSPTSSIATSLNSPEIDADSTQNENPKASLNAVEHEVESTKHEEPKQESPKNDEEDAFSKSFLIGANFGLHNGRNSIKENAGLFEENRNLSFGLDISYQFKRNMMFTSGLFYQQRSEFFLISAQQIDSVLLFSEPIFDIIIDTATTDTTTVIIGYNDFYDYDTTMVNTSTDAVVRLLMLPVAYDLQIYRWRQHEFWLRSGANIGLYRVSGTVLQTAESWKENQFSMQVFARPSYNFNFGKLSTGIFGNFAYDAILPQTWMMTRQRWQIGFGFQVMYGL